MIEFTYPCEIGQCLPTSSDKLHRVDCVEFISATAAARECAMAG